MYKSDKIKVRRNLIVLSKVYTPGRSVSFSRYIKSFDKTIVILRRGKAEDAFLQVSFALQAALLFLARKGEDS